MKVYDLILINEDEKEDNQYLTGTLFDLDFANFIAEIGTKVYGFKFELQERELPIEET